MAKGGKFTIYVTKQINFSTLTIRGTGQYGPLPLSGLSLYVPKRALYTTTSTEVYCGHVR